MAKPAADHAPGVCEGCPLLRTCFTLMLATGWFSRPECNAVWRKVYAERQAYFDHVRQEFYAGRFPDDPPEEETE
jgi:hypothetical protein